MVGGRSLKSCHAQSSYSSLSPKPILQYILIVLVIVSLAISILALFNVNELKKSLPTMINTQDFLNKLTAHDQMRAYVGIAPLNIIQITNNNIANLQAQIDGLDRSFIGSFIVQYTDVIAIYDYTNDVIMGTANLPQPIAQLPADFLTKLNAHSELAGLENEQPVGGQIDQASLDTLRQQLPNIYANAKAGDFLLRYTTKLIIYDYNADVIVNAVDLG
jgi:hypothetical protein|tara:strand:+ start:5084 stop:5737 length:654 start_codon:yes stop_codon:yes gene_type:complete